MKRLTEAAAETAAEAIAILSAGTAAEIVVERTRSREPARSGSASGRAIFSRIHAKLAAVELEVVERGDRILSFLVRRELDESEAAGAAGFSIGADVDADDLSCRGECLGQTILRGVEAQVPDEYFPWNGCFLPFDPEGPSCLVLLS